MRNHVYSRLHCFEHLAVAVALAFASLLTAQTTTETAPVTQVTPVPAGTATLHGHVADQTGALIPGATVSVMNAQGLTVKTTTSDASGSYSVAGLPPGSYIVQVNVTGFASFSSQALPLAAGQTKRVDVSMAVEAEQQNVVVSDEEGAPEVSVEAGANANSIVLKDKDLDALSDDPDELSNELSALAGPSAGPNGGQIYIDGFTGGTLPPKSAIREIRINQNPFSAEFDHIGYGRIEILTKPGTDTLHGRGFLQGNDDAFNTGNPFTKTIPAYHSLQYNGTISGAMSKKASYFLSVEGRNSQDAGIYKATTAVLDPTGNFYEQGVLTGSLFTPSTRLEISPRFDFQLGDRNTLTARVQYEHSSTTNDLGSSTSLPNQATSTSGDEIALQLMDSLIVNEHTVNETRIQVRRGFSSDTPFSTLPQVGVPGYFTGGGDSGQYSSTHSDHLELQNITTMSHGAQAIKFGLWARDNRSANSGNTNYNGSYTFTTVGDYAGALNKLKNGTACPAGAGSAIACGTTNAPSKLNITSGPTKFQANVFDTALFFQDDWKANPFLTLSGGLRWESQNHIGDHSDFGPRVSFAYALDGHKKGKQAKTVIRGGYGFFYDRFSVGNLLGLEQNNGGPNSQTETVISNPSAGCFSPTGVNLANCGTATQKAPQIESLQPTYHSPYSEQFGASVERQISKVATLTLTYMHTYGIHQIATRNANPYEALPGTTLYGPAYASAYTQQTGQPYQRLNPNLGIVDEIYPEAIFKQNQFIANVNARFSQRFNVFGFVNLNYGNGDTGTASNSYNLKQDYGRTGYIRHNMVFLMGNYTGPWGISFNPFLVAQSGRAWNPVTNQDLTGDNFFNDRPGLASSSSCAPSSTVSQYVTTSFGCLDTNPAAGEAILPVNQGNGPAAVAFNLRLSRSIGIGPKIESPAGPNGRRGGPGGPGGFGGIGGGPGGGGHGGGGFGGGGMRGPMASTGRKYSLTFSAQALNLFNDINYGTPHGSIAPTLQSSGGQSITGPGALFGQSTSLYSGSMFASPTGSAARRIFVQAAFSF